MQQPQSPRRSRCRSRHSVRELLNGNRICGNNHELQVSARGKELLHSAVLAEGKETLGRILNTNITRKNSMGTESRSSANQIFELNLRDVSLHHFGPYGGDRVIYPLAKRYVRQAVCWSVFLYCVILLFYLFYCIVLCCFIVLIYCIDLLY